MKRKAMVIMAMALSGCWKPAFMRGDHTWTTGNVKVETDKFTGFTTTSLTDVDLYRSGDQKIRLGAFTSPEQPDRVLIDFISTSEGWRYRDRREVLAIADGARFDFGIAERKSDIISGRLVIESLRVIIGVDQFQALSHAKSTELRIGGVEVTLLQPHKDAMIRFIAALERQPGVDGAVAGQQ